MAELHCNDCLARLWRENRKLPHGKRTSRSDLVAQLHEQAAKAKVSVPVKVRHYRFRSGAPVPSQAKCDPCHKRYLDGKPGLVEVVEET